VIEKGVGMVVEAMTPKLSTNERVQDFVKRLIAQQRPEGISNALKAIAGRSDSSELFATFKFPVVIVHGDADLLIPIKRGREMKAALPSANYFELAGLGHMAMMEKPPVVTKALSTLIK
jgi:pimeloyl-ACP methyl ester carboxylesterase